MGVVLLLGVFIGTLLYGIGMGLDIECGCLGPGYHVSLMTQLTIDLGMLVWVRARPLESKNAAA